MCTSRPVDEKPCSERSLPATALQVLAQSVEPGVPLLAGRGEAVPRLAAGALRFDEPRLAEGRQVLRDIDRDRFMTPEEAIEYGLIDAVMEPRAASAAAAG
jgi:hypothetical protein